MSHDIEYCYIYQILFGKNKPTIFLTIQELKTF